MISRKNESLLVIPDLLWLRDRTILLTETGSKAYGTSTESSDTDIKGVCIPPIDYYLGLNAFNEYNNHGGNNFRNTKDDVDLIVMHINKFVKDCLIGVPNNIELLFVEKSKYIRLTELGELLVDNRHLFLSKQLRAKFGGYAYSQIQKLKLKGKNGTGRQELISKYGFDTKFAMHSVRLLTSAIEILDTGDFHTYRPNRQFLLDIRNGKYTFEDILDMISQYDDQLKKVLETSKLPAHPDYQKVDKMLIDINKNGLNL